jgi:hypothetical protein
MAPISTGFAAKLPMTLAATPTSPSPKVNGHHRMLTHSTARLKGMLRLRITQKEKGREGWREVKAVEHAPCALESRAALSEEGKSFSGMGVVFLDFLIHQMPGLNT